MSESNQGEQGETSPIGEEVAGKPVVVVCILVLSEGDLYMSLADLAKTALGAVPLEQIFESFLGDLEMTPRFRKDFGGVEEPALPEADPGGC